MADPHRGAKERREPAADPEHPEQEMHTVPRFSSGESGRTCHLLGRRLARVTVTPGAVVLEIRAMEGSLEVEVAGPFRLRTDEGSWSMDPATPETIAPLLARITRGLERIRADRGGSLKIVFEDGAKLQVPGNAFSPTWEVQGSGDLEAVRPFFRGR